MSGSKERTKNLYICFSEVASAISVNPGDIEGGGAFSRGRKSSKNVSTDKGPTKECRISTSGIGPSLLAWRGADEKSVEVRCVFLAGVESEGQWVGVDK